MHLHWDKICYHFFSVCVSKAARESWLEEIYIHRVALCWMEKVAKLLLHVKEIKHEGTFAFSTQYSKNICLYSEHSNQSSWEWLLSPSDLS